MYIIDEVLAARAVAGQLPVSLTEAPLAICTSAHWRLLRAVLAMQFAAPGPVGQIQRLLAPMSRPQRVAIHAPAPEVLQVMDPRLHSSVAASFANEHGLNWFVADHVGAAAFHEAELVFSSARRVPPAITTGRGTGLVPYRIVT
ncbi:hypothetical protein [Candidatus Poriferisodalis sp.]|uniref:hypothetical protein n=1 Tax=Candidatus Poriferisodalis sp. TaxID=3101277 RepID=UPI003B01D8E6